ncbi:hypothetical protein [Candidatus Bodocaedibacter vickermanii]|uniref:Uncharacterized protein n=1 Tax=Candidatus Bodocaedibacter vickermanii TaxID=2741701 RepID=A0A7L9RSP3_9PROT|nr:hypothetical protein CPBP_00397 [Candidatus Paracaedibacteraceae bacterium 'Lake Konstanz']
MKKYLLTLSSLALAFGVTHAAEGVLAVPCSDDGITSTADTVFGGGSVVEVADPLANMTLDTAEMPVSSWAGGGFPAAESPAVGVESDVLVAAAAAADVPEVSTAEEGAADVSEANADVLAPPAAVEINTSEEGATTHAAEDDAGMAREMTEIVGEVETAEEGAAEVVPVKKKKVRKPDGLRSVAREADSDEESAESADAGTAATVPAADGSESDADGVDGDSSGEREDAPELPNSN